MRNVDMKSRIKLVEEIKWHTTYKVNIKWLYKKYNLKTKLIFHYAGNRYLILFVYVKNIISYDVDLALEFDRFNISRFYFSVYQLDTINHVDQQQDYEFKVWKFCLLNFFNEIITFLHNDNNNDSMELFYLVKLLW